MTGNLMTPAVIQRLGMGLGVTIWGIGNLVTGWATGHFGLCGIDAEPVPKPMLNWCGFILACLSLAFFAQAGEAPKNEEIGVDKNGLISTTGKSAANTEWTKGFLMAVFTGVLFGSNFDPSTLLIQESKIKPGSHSSDVKDYVFSHFTGILCMAVVALLIYCVAMGNKKYISLKIVGPGILSGLIWGVAQSAWFIANEKLSLVVAFPLCTTLPGVVSMLWGMFLFGEFSSRKSRGFAAAAVCVLAPGVTLIALSK